MDFSENMRIRGITTIFRIGIGCDTLKLSLADKWTSGVSLANSSFVFVELGADHVLTVEVFRPRMLALIVELQFLSGLLENR